MRVLPIIAYLVVTVGCWVSVAVTLIGDGSMTLQMLLGLVTSFIVLYFSMGIVATCVLVHRMKINRVPFKVQLIIAVWASVWAIPCWPYLLWRWSDQ